MNFWGDDLNGHRVNKKPIMILAPMDGVTDTVFRQIVIKAGETCLPAGRPDVFFTEFIPVDALLSKGKERALLGLKYSQAEKPIVAQIWGSDPQKFYQVAQLLSEMKFDGVDINMGCPVKDTIKTGACSALIKNPKLAQDIINATIKGAHGLPVSVKTRIGFNKIETETWVSSLLQTPIAALTLHLRTAAEMSKVSAHWEEITKVVAIKRRLHPKCVIIGNGDIKTLKEAKEKCKQYEIDGVMIGRGIFENVWLFNEKVDPAEITPKQKIALLLKHLDLFNQTYKDTRHFESMKKFVKCYVNGFPKATESRNLLMKTKNLDELIQETKELSSL